MRLLSRSASFRLGSGVVAFGLMSTVAGCGSAADTATSGGALGVTATAITIGDIAALSGPLGAQWTEVNKAFIAAIDEQNAKGGVYGRTINVITADDQSSPNSDLKAAQSLVEAKGVFMIAHNSSLVNASSAYLASHNIPAVQPGDNPAVGSLPNYFVATGAINPSPTVAATTSGLILKEIGATKVGALSQSISAAAGQAAQETLASAKAAGLQAGYLNTTLPATVTDWTPYVLGFKDSGTDAVKPALTPSDTLNFLTAASQQGVHLKALLDTGYDFNLLTSSTANPVMQGAYVLAQYAPSELDTPATRAATAALQQYGHFTHPAGRIPSQGYALGVLLIRALQAAGPNPTREGLIKNMRAVTDYTANGLLPVPVNFADALNPAFQPPNQSAYGNCNWVLKVVGDNFVPVSTKPFCGTLFKVG
jgi:branched-chain amino acid transport system substrate-binding protein